MDVATQFAQAASRFQQGDLAGAQALAQGILAVQPGHAEANFLLGIIAARSGQLAVACPLFERAIQGSPGQPQYHYNYGLALQRGGRLEAALAAYDEATRLQPGYLEAHNNRGAVLRSLGRPAEALAAYERVVALNPALAEVHYYRGLMSSALGREEAALAAYERAVELKPGFAEAHNNRGAVLVALGRPVEALAAYDRALELNAGIAELHNNRGAVLRELGREAEALQAHEQALRLKPDFAEAHNNRGAVLMALGFPEAALAACDQALEFDPALTAAHNTRGLVLRDLNRLDEAMVSYRRSLELQPDSPDAYNNLGNALRDLGRMEEAEASYLRALEIKPDYAGVYRNLMMVHKTVPDDELVASMEHLYSRPDTTPDSRIHLGFALGKAYSDLETYTKAIPCYQEANRLMRATFEYDLEKDARKVEFLRGLFTPEYMSRYVTTGATDDTPVFIVGMPRSGTTLVEQILASHPQVAAAGELPFVEQLVAQNQADAGQNRMDWLTDADPGVLAVMGNEYLQRIRAYGRPGVRHITDKMPANFWYVGFIRLILPNARIIHVRRDARDTCLSIYTYWFSGHHNYAYDLTELGGYYRLYVALMEHWKQLLPGQIHEISYDILVQDLQGEVRRLLAYCGLQFDDRCLAFHETRRAVKTASFAQVRQAVYQTSRGRWKPYEHMLQPLLSALEPSQ